MMKNIEKILYFGPVVLYNYFEEKCRSSRLESFPERPFYFL
jgi:hypothetical protein